MADNPLISSVSGLQKVSDVEQKQSEQINTRLPGEKSERTAENSECNKCKDEKQTFKKSLPVQLMWLVGPFHRHQTFKTSIKLLTSKTHELNRSLLFTNLLSRFSPYSCSGEIVQLQSA